MTAKEKKEDIQKLQEQNAVYLNGWRRAQADYENLKKETAQKQARMSQVVLFGVLTEILPVLDNLQSALVHAPEEPKEWTEGIKHIERQFLDVLKQFNVEPIDALGKQFDPEFMEAVDECEGEKDGEVLEVQKSGYKIGDFCLRSARVVVSKNK